MKNYDDRVIETMMVRAIVAAGTPRTLYQTAWQIRRKQFSNCGDRYLWDYYHTLLEEIRQGSVLGARIMDQIQQVAYRVLGAH